MIKKILALVIVILVVAVGVVAYSFFKTPEEASGSIEAVPITTDVEESIAAETGSVTAEATAAPVEEATPTTKAAPQAETEMETATVPEPEPQAEPEVETDTLEEPETQADASTDGDASIDAQESTDTETETDAGAQATVTPEPQASVSAQDAPSEETSAAPVIFEIVPAESQARFLIDEVLRGSPVTVVGATDQVAGQLALNPADLSSAQVGIIQVNARTLATDNDFRNRAIKNRILLTDNHEFVTFTPTEVVGLPVTGAEGETYNFQIVGGLTVTDVTQSVTFDVVATATSDTRIEGTASTVFLYTDFGLFIPDAPAVDTVDDEVRLELEFVAEALS